MQSETSREEHAIKAESDEEAASASSIDATMPYWVYRVNFAEWWAADSLKQAIEAAAIWYELPKEEIIDELEPPYKLTEEQMFQTLIDVNGVAVPFWFELTRLYREGEPFPRLFGRSEA